MQGLSSLWLDDCPITDAGLAHLKNLKDLTSLNLSRTPITDEGMVHLAEVGKLSFLSLGGPNITSAGSCPPEAAREPRPCIFTICPS